MRWLVVGAKGMLGQDVTALLAERGEHVEGIDREEIDIADPQACLGVADGFDVVMNCAAYTAVDAAEADEATAFAINAVGAANLARAARNAGARTVQISTDYVFDGHAAQPYAEDAPLAPRSAYGRTKGAGEWAVRAENPDHLVVRTAWLYGAHGGCFPKTIVRVARERGELEVVDDQVGQPTWTVDLADLVHRLVSTGARAGTYHGTSSGQTSWHGFAQAAVAAAGMDPGIVRTTTSEGYVRAAPRPSYSVLDHTALRAVSVEPIDDWARRWAEASETVLLPG
ncbi:dTDP-4-dehydrorhamnose reductase [Actinotalea sp. K2]|uniref:dTDP-4-dehydrorhamnose reductase n=1 Tax=Actinotalea sp. K2 TaxID=2939438 RepID=UPI0020179227|nr:dTDP-4-dehydrorhamnose reductase [Actinotalea sp. K2]MCL3862696.1 dTDP-4-dehydrorhamnose reductase [Actinotalea sp. K2]